MADHILLKKMTVSVEKQKLQDTKQNHNKRCLVVFPRWKSLMIDKCLQTDT